MVNETPVLERFDRQAISVVHLAVFNDRALRTKIIVSQSQRYKLETKAQVRSIERMFEKYRFNPPTPLESETRQGEKELKSPAWRQFTYHCPKLSSCCNPINCLLLTP